MKIQVVNDNQLTKFMILRSKMKEFLNLTNREINKVYDIILFLLRIEPLEYYDLDDNFKRIFVEFYNDIIEIIQNIEHFENLTKSKYFYDKNNDAIKKVYKKHNAVYPNDSLNRNTPKYTLKNGLYYKPFTNRLVRINKCDNILAYDSETYKGKCKLLCRNIGLNKPIYIYNPTFNDCIEFLSYWIDKKNTYRFFWNIDYDIQAILKLYDLDDKDSFVDKLSKGIEVVYKNYKLQWIRGLYFKIKNLKRKRNVFFTDLFKFYKLGLGVAGKKYLRQSKFPNIDGKRLNTDLNYWNKHIKKIKEYCIQDCNLTQKLGWVLIDSIKKVDLKLPRLLVSGASLSKQNYRFENYIPSIKHTPIKIVQIGFDCYYGGRFEMPKRGTFKKGYLYDINSQYSTFIKDLPDMFNGFWKQYKNLKELPKESCLGYFLVQVNIPENNILSTIPIKDDIVRFPNGFIWKWCTWYDLDLIRDYIVYIKKAYIYEPNSDNYKPFEKITLNLYDKKSSLKSNSNKMLYNVVKLCLNALYGCFIEKKDIIEILKDDNKEIESKKIKGGILFNPIYASHISAYGRWSVLKDIPKKKWKNIIGIHTDSVMTNIDMSKHLDIGKELGQWNLEKKGKVIMLNTGMYQIGIGKKAIVKTRGIPKKEIKTWFKFCKKHKNTKTFTCIIPRMLKIRQAIVQEKSIVNVNVMIDMKRSVNINSDSKRCWYDNFDNFNDMLNRNIDSLPLYAFKGYFRLKPNPIVLTERTKEPIEMIRLVLKKQDVF